MAKMKWARNLAATALIVAGSAGALFSQTGVVERIKVHGSALEKNLSGDTADRDVSIYLPPGYATDRDRRYPVVYLLHGYADSDETWFGASSSYHADAAMDRAISGGAIREIILVMPNSFTVFQGSFYSNSPVTGNWEAFIARDLVAYVDQHYRTIAEPASRGLAGHSMGGYGALRIGMKHPEVFSGIYIMSGCCLVPGRPSATLMRRAAGIRTMEDVTETDYPTRTVLATAAAWSPNTANPPLFFDLPIKNGQLQPEVAAKWAANAPVATLREYLPNLRKLRAIAMDAGNKDEEAGPGTNALHQALTQNGISHSFEIYDGDHTGRIAERFGTKVLPFFNANLSFSTQSQD